ncbi:sulfurtransferase TusA family protein [Ferrimonas marina]|uniref:TusA-related sulfurtransferase n=1 Tax=Ferrimonas marina TaxID=299255 RepID=A0A1M5RH24_9GAMM|nr:sulfurtransferase TusA family protein [Ferrimonas marina]SHH25093.1 TusA-related sulfurtransferase [Ferrimonas marina]
MGPAIQTVDLRQERCPLAFVKAKLAIRDRDPGQALAILISDPGTRRDVPRWLQKVGIEYELTQQDDKHWVVILYAQ